MYIIPKQDSEVKIKISISGVHKHAKVLDYHERLTCNICLTIASGALSLMFPTNTVVTGGLSSESPFCKGW